MIKLTQVPIHMSWGKQVFYCIVSQG